MNEGIDIRETMLKDRRDWINEKMQNENSKIPDDITKFYERFNVVAPLSPEEEALKAQEEEDAKNAKKKKKGDKKGGKKGKGKKKDDEEDPAKGAAKLGNSEATRKFEEQYKEYNEDWAQRDEIENYKQEHDIELARVEVMP